MSMLQSHRRLEWEASPAVVEGETAEVESIWLGCNGVPRGQRVSAELEEVSNRRRGKKLEVGETYASV